MIRKQRRLKADGPDFDDAGLPEEEGRPVNAGRIRGVACRSDGVRVGCPPRPSAGFRPGGGPEWGHQRFVSLSGRSRLLELAPRSALRAADPSLFARSFNIFFSLLSAVRRPSSGTHIKYRQISRAIDTRLETHSDSLDVCFLLAIFNL